MRHEFITLDQGPNFVGLVGRVGETRVCVMTPRVLDDESAKLVARKLVRRQGGDCSTCDCGGCPLR